jgi:hypothetical protein
MPNAPLAESHELILISIVLLKLSDTNTNGYKISHWYKERLGY